MTARTNCPDCQGTKSPRAQRCNTCARARRNPTWLHTTKGTPEAHARTQAAHQANRLHRQQAQENARLAQLARDAGLA